MTRITPEHLARDAFIYVRQSTNDQVLNNHESRRRQYGLAERARALSLNFSGMYLGTVVAFLASPPIIVAFGWPALFYISGALGVVWVAVWMLAAAAAAHAAPAAGADTDDFHAFAGLTGGCRVTAVVTGDDRDRPVSRGEAGGQIRQELRR